MLKAIKECLKNWLVVHERLYWYIVVGLAVLGFGIVTAMGMAKVERANAAESVFVPDWRTEVVGNTSYIDATMDFKYCFVTLEGSSITFFRYVFCNDFRVETHEGVYYLAPYDYQTHNVVQSTLEHVGYSHGVEKWCEVIYSGDVYKCSKIVASNWDWRGGNADLMGYTAGGLSYPVYTPPASYSPDAPYVKFDSLNVKNDIAADKGKFFDSLNYYDNFIVPAYWEYVGHMENYQNYPGAEYLLEVNFTVELPRLEYIQSLANKLDIDIQWTYNMVKWGSDLIDLWNQDSMALKNTYQFMYNFPVDIDSNGNFSFRLSYPEIENLIRYFSESAREQFNSYDSETLGILFSFLHVDSCSISVKTSSADSVLYGKSTVNHFERGVYDTCVEVEIDLDILNKSEEEIDKIIQDSISAGYEQYYKDLEDRVNSLEGQLGDVSNIQAGFGGNLETTDLWSGFTGLVQGLGSLAPAVQSLSSLTGVVLSFLPLQMSSIMATTMFAICVIAVIKAIRG